MDTLGIEKEPQRSEFGFFRSELLLFTFLHLAAYPDIAGALLGAGTTGIAYRSDRVETPGSWAVLFDPEATDEPFVLLDDMRPMIGVALLYLGYDYNSEDPDELTEAINQVRNGNTYVSDSLREMLPAGAAGNDS
jgi:hypothetical protein